jgi:hypothetical protein
MVKLVLNIKLSRRPVATDWVLVALQKSVRYLLFMSTRYAQSPTHPSVPATVSSFRPQPSDSDISSDPTPLPRPFLPRAHRAPGLYVSTDLRCYHSANMPSFFSETDLMAETRPDLRISPHAKCSWRPSMHHQILEQQVICLTYCHTSMGSLGT